jgi:hypothetical protein
LRTSGRIDSSLLVSILALAVFVLLFTARSLDDNRLTSWLWVFNSVEGYRVYAALAAGILLANLLSRYPFPGARMVFVLVFAASALFWGEPEVIVDSSRYFTQAKHLSTYGIGPFIREWGVGILAWTDMPLVPFLYGIGFKWIGESRLLIQAFNTFIFALTAMLTCLLGRDIWGEDVGKGAGLLLLGMPYIYTQVPLMLVDVHSMFVLTLSVFSFNRALTRGGAAYFGLAVASVVMCVYAKYSLWLMLSVLGAVLLIGMREAPARVLVRGLSILMISGCIAGAGILYKYGVVSEQITLLLEYQRPGLGRWSESFISTFLFQIHPFITLGAIFSIYLAIRRRDARHLIISWLPVLLVAMQIKRARYMIPILPMFSLMAAYAMAGIRDEGIRRLVVYTAVFTSLALSAFAFMPFLKMNSAINLVEAGAYLDTLDVSSVRVYTLPQRSYLNPAAAVPLLDFSTDKELLYEYDAESLPPPKSYLVSPLRFTWHYMNPQYYGDRSVGEDVAAVVISGRRDDPLPEDLRESLEGLSLKRVFSTASGAFRFRSIVRVYHGS